ncbi:uncharacterized protein LOC142605876 [Castanea sativa]|uniref:uncharacterized protein LOC142605876 n=1 Tax=Castanea sativa TaxID=21020 RepID=UPI003F6505DF
MDNPTNWDNSPPEDLSKSWEENCQDQLRNIHELNKFGLQLLTDWQRRRDVAILQLLVHVVHGIWMMGIYCSPHYVDKVLTESSGERENVWQELLSELRCSRKFRDIIRMGPYAFAKLCEILRGTGCLKDNRNASVEEQVAKFLYILAHNERICTVSFFFRRSKDTISRHFHNVLRAVIYLEDQFLLQPNGAEIALIPGLCGAIDVTNIHVKVSATDAPRY